MPLLDADLRLEAELRRMKLNSEGLVWPTEYADCFRAALCRMSIVLNAGMPNPPAELSLIMEDDDQILEYSRNHGLWNRCCAIVLGHIDRPDEHTAIALQDVAHHFFYGHFEFNTTKFSKSFIQYHLPEAFLKFSYDGLRWPAQSLAEPYSHEELNRGEISPNALMRRCATAYLLRNFWHNFVHNHYQGINKDTTRSFAGAARHDSDIEADNLSLMLLAKSYGLPLQADRVDAGQPFKELVYLFRRIRCNYMFGLRARARKEEGGWNEFRKFEELEWRLRRRLVGYLAGWLIAQGLAVVQLNAHWTGPVKYSEKKRRVYRERPGVSVTLNGARLYVSRRVPNDAGAEFAQYLRNVAAEVQIKYEELLRRDPNAAHFAKSLLDSTAVWMGCPSGR